MQKTWNKKCKRAIERLRAERGPFASDDELLLTAYYYDPKILGDLFNEKGETVSGLRFRGKNCLMAKPFGKEEGLMEDESSCF
ncbi:MAG: hypothetical protein AB1556_06005 [Bacillota bacterium]